MQGSAKNAGHDGRSKVIRKIFRLHVVFLEIRFMIRTSGYFWGAIASILIGQSAAAQNVT